MIGRVLSPIVLLVLLPSLAFASLPITEFRQPRPVPASALGPDGMPIPERAGALSARNALVPVGVGAFLCAIFTLGPMAQGDHGTGYGLPIVGIGLATVEGAVRRHNATLPRPTWWRLGPCLTPSAHAPGLASRANFGGAEGSR